MFDLKIIICRCDLYFMVQWFCLISWRLFAVWTSYFRIMSQYDPTFDHKMNVGHCDLYFMVHWFALYLEDYLIYEHHTLFYESTWPDVWLKINVGHCDLYFMVQWICLISWRLFDVWTLYFVIMSHCNAAFALKQCRSQWFIFSWSIDFALYLK